MEQVWHGTLRSRNAQRDHNIQRDHSAKRNHGAHRHFFSATLDQFLFPDPNAVRSNRQG